LESSDREAPVSLRELAALLRRHVVAAIVILVLAAGLAYHFKHARQPYVDTATVAFVAPGHGINVFSTSLLAVNQVMATYIMSPLGQQEVRKAGGASDYNVSMVNLYNVQFPAYGVPYSVITASSPDPAEAQRTFTAVTQVLQDNLASRQARQGVNPDERVGMRLIAAPTGPIEPTGSRKRMIAGLAVLTVVVGFMLLTFLDRHSIRLRSIVERLERRNGAGRIRAEMRVRRGAE
jgi:hypothetical protein